MQNEITVDKLAQEIRRVDGGHNLGAGQLAEALMPMISAALAAAEEKEPVAWYCKIGDISRTATIDPGLAELYRDDPHGIVIPLYARPSRPSVDTSPGWSLNKALSGFETNFNDETIELRFVSSEEFHYACDALTRLVEPPSVDTEARRMAAMWRADAFEKSAQIVERYGADPEIAAAIRALIPQEGKADD